jgi:hypothetical protein
MPIDEYGHTELPKREYRRCEWPDLELTEFQWRIIDSIEAEGGVTNRKGILKYCETTGKDGLESEDAKRKDGSTVHRHINYLVEAKVLKKDTRPIPGYKHNERFRVNWPGSKPSPAKGYRDFVPG